MTAQMSSNMDRDARALAEDLHYFLLARHETRPLAEDPEDAALLEHEKATVSLYEDRYGRRAQALATTFLAKGAEKRDAFFRHVNEGPKGEHDVFQICAGLVRVNNGFSVARA